MKARVNVPMIPMTVAEPARHGRLGGAESSVMQKSAGQRVGI